MVEALLAGQGGAAGAWLCDGGGRTPLICGAQEGHMAVCAVLLRHVAPEAAEPEPPPAASPRRSSRGGREEAAPPPPGTLDSADKEGLCALAWAALMEHAEVCCLLVEAGADRGALTPVELVALERAEAEAAAEAAAAQAAAAQAAAAQAPQEGREQRVAEFVAAAAAAMAGAVHRLGSPAAAKATDTAALVAVLMRAATGGEAGGVAVAEGEVVAVAEEEEEEEGSEGGAAAAPLLPAALVLVAKWPGSGAAKTRLARGLGAALAAQAQATQAYFTDAAAPPPRPLDFLGAATRRAADAAAEGAAEARAARAAREAATAETGRRLASGFALASIRDLLLRYGAALRATPEGALRRVLLYAPATEEAAAGFTALLRELGEAQARRLLPNLNPNPTT